MVVQAVFTTEGVPPSALPSVFRKVRYVFGAVAILSVPSKLATASVKPFCMRARMMSPTAVTLSVMVVVPPSCAVSHRLPLVCTRPANVNVAPAKKDRSTSENVPN